MTILVALVVISLISGNALLQMRILAEQEQSQAKREREALSALVWKRKNEKDAETKGIEVKNIDALQEQELPEENSWESPIDFDYLSDCNPDTVAWLWIPDTNIDYPVVQSKDNETYMSRDFYGEEKKSGTIFLDFQSELPQTSLETGKSYDSKSTNQSLRELIAQPKNCVFYGHYMKNGSMFRDIARYQDQTYFDTHRQIWLYTPQATLELEAVEWFSAPNSQELRDLCLTETDKGTYAFVTCSYDGKDNRGILWARQVLREEK